MDNVELLLPRELEDHLKQDLENGVKNIASILCDKLESNKTIEVVVRYIEPGDVNPTKESLKQKNYNTDVHRNGSWMENLLLDIANT